MVGDRLTFEQFELRVAVSAATVDRLRITESVLGVEAAWRLVWLALQRIRAYEREDACPKCHHLTPGEDVIICTQCGWSRHTPARGC